MGCARMIAWAAVLIGFCVHPLLGQDATVDVAEKCATICQPTDAPWRSIPWQIDLLEAQRLAVEQSRPLLIWAMDGHPLGCT